MEGIDNGGEKMEFIIVNETEGYIADTRDNLHDAINLATELWERSNKEQKFSVYIKVTDI